MTMERPHRRPMMSSMLNLATIKEKILEYRVFVTMTLVNLVGDVTIRLFWKFSSKAVRDCDDVFLYRVIASSDKMTASKLAVTKCGVAAKILPSCDG